MKLTWEIPPALQPSPDPVASRELGLFTRRRLILVKSWQWTPPTSHWIWSMRIILFDVCLLALILIFLQAFIIASYSQLEKTSGRVGYHPVQGLGKRMEMCWPVHDMYRMRVPMQGDPARQRWQFTEMHTLEIHTLWHCRSFQEVCWSSMWGWRPAQPITVGLVQN